MLLLVSFITFIAFSVIPGDSVTTALGTEATEETVEAWRQSLGYNDPVLIRYGKWIKGVVVGEFGVSTQYHVQVSKLLKEKLPVTIWLAALSTTLITVVGIPLGIWMAKLKSVRLQQMAVFISQMFMSIPSFFLGMILSLCFGILLEWYTPGAYVSQKEDFTLFLKYLILPAIAVAVPKISMVAKFTANSIRREMSLDYVRTAYSKGSTRTQVFLKHIVKNAMMPVITFLGMVIADVLAGSMIVEQVFNLPGVGRLLVTSIGSRDLFVVQAIVLYIITVVIVVNFIVDLLYLVVDPRVRQ